MLEGKTLPIFNRPICREPSDESDLHSGRQFAESLLKIIPVRTIGCNCTMQVVGTR